MPSPARHAPLVAFHLAAPLLSLATTRAARGYTRGLVLALGALWYCFYNGAGYLFGAALGLFSPLYVVTQVSCAFTLIVTVRGLEPEAIAAAFGPRTPAPTGVPPAPGFGGQAAARRRRAGAPGGGGRAHRGGGRGRGREARGACIPPGARRSRNVGGP